MFLLKGNRVTGSRTIVASAVWDVPGRKTLHRDAGESPEFYETEFRRVSGQYPKKTVSK